MTEVVNQPVHGFLSLRPQNLELIFTRSVKHIWFSRQTKLGVAVDAGGRRCERMDQTAIVRAADRRAGPVVFPTTVLSRPVLLPPDFASPAALDRFMVETG